MPKSKEAVFEGFSRDLPKFLARLQKHNEKAWFDAHRAEYESLYLVPAELFVSALAASLPKSLAAVHPLPRVGGSIMRINRDTHYKRVPRGFDPEHPNAKLLRHRGLSLHAETRPPKALFGPDAFPFCIERMQELLPIPTWVEKHVMKA